MSYTPYSPELAPSDYYFFLSLQISLRNEKFERKKISNFLNIITENKRATLNQDKILQRMIQTATLKCTYEIVKFKQPKNKINIQRKLKVFSSEEIQE